MRKKKKLQSKSLSLWLVIGFLGIVATAGIVFAFSGSASNVVEVCNDCEVGKATVERAQDSSFGMNFGGGTRFPSGLAVGNTSPTRGEALLNTTTTIQEITYGSRFSEALSQTAGATTTPGGMASIQNTGEAKICTGVQLELVTAPTVHSVWSVGTSTSATAWSGATGGLIASSTVATSTAVLIDERDGSDMASWLWDNGVYLNVVGDQNTADGANENATSTSADWTSVVGDVYVECHTR